MRCTMFHTNTAMRAAVGARAVIDGLHGTHATMARCWSRPLPPARNVVAFMTTKRPTRPLGGRPT